MQLRSRELQKLKWYRWVSSLENMISSCDSSNSCRLTPKGIGNRIKCFLEKLFAACSSKRSCRWFQCIELTSANQQWTTNLLMESDELVLSIRSPSRFAGTAIACESPPTESYAIVCFRRRN